MPSEEERICKQLLEFFKSPLEKKHGGGSYHLDYDSGVIKCEIEVGGFPVLRDTPPELLALLEDGLREIDPILPETFEAIKMMPTKLLFLLYKDSDRWGTYR